MTKLKLFIDIHDAANGTFPAGIATKDFVGFYKKYEQACQEEGVINLKVDVGFEEGRAFCLNLAKDSDAIRRAHQKVGLPFDSITEVVTASSKSILFDAIA